MRQPVPYSKRGKAGRQSAADAGLTDIIASTRDGRDITGPWVRGLQQPHDRRLLGAVDWGAYDRILEDDQVFSTLQQRRRAVVSHNWSVLPGDDNDPLSVEAADALDASLKRIGWDRVTDKMLLAIFHGISVAEIIWEPRDGLLDFGDIRVRHARRFRFDDEARLRLLTRTDTTGEIMPDRKFWVVTAGGGDDDDLYGRGLAEWLYWPSLFKRNGIRFWNIFLDKYGTPTAVGKYRPGTGRGDVEKLLATLQAIATDSGIAIPEGMAIEFLQIARSGTADFEQLARYMDEAIAKVVLSQTMTTQDGSSRSQAEVHAGVKLEVVKADADLLSDSFNTGPARWWTDLNYGPDVASPIVMREVEEEADTKAQADTDSTLKTLGWVRTEESFRDTYGDGYERDEPENVDDHTADDLPVDGSDLVPQRPRLPSPKASPQLDPAIKEPVSSFAAPRSLYAERKLLNAGDVIAWANAQGFPSVIEGDDLHVTIAYSRQPLDWAAIQADTSGHLVPPGGPRAVQRIGDEGAVALFFFSRLLEQRNETIRAGGAGWDFDGYFPHVTITYDPGDIDLAEVEPYPGELRFGPELFAPIEEEWQARIKELSFVEDAPAGGPGSNIDDVVDRLVAADGYRPLRDLGERLVERLAGAADQGEIERILRDDGAIDESRIAEIVENASFAAALDAIAEEANDSLKESDIA